MSRHLSSYWKIKHGSLKTPDSPSRGPSVLLKVVVSCFLKSSEGELPLPRGCAPQTNIDFLELPVPSGSDSNPQTGDTHTRQHARSHTDTLSVVQSGDTDRKTPPPQRPRWERPVRSEWVYATFLKNAKVNLSDHFCSYVIAKLLWQLYYQMFRRVQSYVIKVMFNCEEALETQRLALLCLSLKILLLFFKLLFNQVSPIEINDFFWRKTWPFPRKPSKTETLQKLHVTGQFISHTYTVGFNYQTYFQHWFCVSIFPFPDLQFLDPFSN